MKARTGRATAAFTLIELLVALTIIVILTLLGMPAIEPMIKTKSVDSAANIIKGALMHARNTAVAEAQPARCWLAPGSVFESGVVGELSTDADPFTVCINENDSGWLTEGTVNYKCSLEGSWTQVSLACSYEGQLHYAYGGGSGGTSVAKWIFKFSVPVTAKVYARWTEALDRTTVKYKVYHKDALPYEASMNQQTPGDKNGENWNLLRTEDFHFNANVEYRVELDNTYGNSGNKMIADAIKLVGDVEQGDPNTECVVNDKSWKENAWVGYYAIISNASDNSTLEPIVAQIQSNTDTKLTVASWQPNNPPGGSWVLLVRGDPRTTSGKHTATIGSGTLLSARWDALPENVEVCPKNATAEDSFGDRVVFPVMFSNVGRARFASDSANDSITIKVRDKEEPGNRDMWRFIRIYRNTGRATMARKYSDLP